MKGTGYWKDGRQRKQKEARGCSVTLMDPANSGELRGSEKRLGFLWAEQEYILHGDDVIRARSTGRDWSWMQVREKPGDPDANSCGEGDEISIGHGI